MRFARHSLAAVGAMAVFAAAVVANGEEIEEVEEGSEAGWVTSIAALDPSGHFVASTADGLLLREASVVTFDAANPTEQTPLYQHPAAVWRVVVVGDGQQVASVDYRGNLVVYDVATEEATTHQEAFKRWSQAMIVDPDGESLVAGNEAGEILVWDLDASEISQSIELDEYAVTGLAFSPDGSQLAATDGAGHVHLLKWPELEATGEITVGEEEETAWCVAYVDDGSTLLIGSADRQLYSCPPEADAEAKPILKGTDWITQVAVSPSGEVAVAEIGGRIRFPFAGEDSEPLTAESGAWALGWNGNTQLLVGTRKNGVLSAGQSWTWIAHEASDDEDSDEDESEEDESEEDESEDDESDDDEQ